LRSKSKVKRGWIISRLAYAIFILMDWNNFVPIVVFFLFLITLLGTGIKLILNKNIKREMKFMGALFIVCAFAIGIMMFKEYLDRGPTALIQMGTYILNHRR
jgi:hypothetical protein